MIGDFSRRFPLNIYDSVLIFPGKPDKTPTPFSDSPQGASQESPSTRLEELTSETPDSSKTQVALAETIPDSLGVLKRGLTVGP